MFFVYIIQSMMDSSYYVRQFNNLGKRMSKHNDGFSKYTASKKPWRLRYFEAYASRPEALKREKEIKKQKSRILLESLIKNWDETKNHRL